jgi:hypothetical protein
MRRTLAVALSAGLAAAVAAGPVAMASAAPVRNAAPVRGAVASGPQFFGHEVFVIIALKEGSEHPKVVAKGTFHAVGHLDFGRRVGIIVFKHGQITITHHVISNSGSVPTPPSCRFTITQRGTFAITKGTKRYTGLRGSGDYQTTIHGRLGHTSNGLCTSKIVSYRSVTYDRGFVR